MLIFEETVSQKNLDFVKTTADNFIPTSMPLFKYLFKVNNNKIIKMSMDAFMSLQLTLIRYLPMG